MRIRRSRRKTSIQGNIDWFTGLEIIRLMELSLKAKA